MTLDEKIVEAVACSVFHAKPRNRIWDTLPNEFKNQYRKQARAAITAYQAEAVRQPRYMMTASAGDFTAIEAALKEPGHLVPVQQDMWQDISTAPRDGRKIWVYGGRHETPHLTDADGEWWNSTLCPDSSRPTHWMPTPATPNPPASP